MPEAHSGGTGYATRDHVGSMEGNAMLAQELLSDDAVVRCRVHQCFDFAVPNKNWQCTLQIH